jgi:hypothetical protein
VVQSEYLTGLFSVAPHPTLHSHSCTLTKLDG